MNTRGSEMSERRLHVPLLLWLRVHRQLRHRSGDVRESGAFLLGTRGKGDVDLVRAFVCYDDLDPTCLAGGYVEFHSNGYANLWETCRRLQYEVLADVHTHPGKDSSQSETDRTHPMVSEVGYLAIILPEFAAGRIPQLARMSIYEYEGNYSWRNWTGVNRSRRLRFTWW